MAKTETEQVASQYGSTIFSNLWGSAGGVCGTLLETRHPLDKAQRLSSRQATSSQILSTLPNWDHARPSNVSAYWEPPPNADE